jgi:5S rRNA maturation endonuclease (ribonuclease M5)
MDEELKNFIKSAEYREIEKWFEKEAHKIKHGKIDRNRPYEDQGHESHVRELASEAILTTLKNLRNAATKQPIKKISYK